MKKSTIALWSALGVLALIAVAVVVILGAVI
jgi:hypothetical protein